MQRRETMAFRITPDPCPGFLDSGWASLPSQRGYILRGFILGKKCEKSQNFFWPSWVQGMARANHSRRQAAGTSLSKHLPCSFCPLSLEGCELCSLQPCDCLSKGALVFHAHNIAVSIILDVGCPAQFLKQQPSCHHGPCLPALVFTAATIQNGICSLKT